MLAMLIGTTIEMNELVARGNELLELIKAV